MIDEGVGTLVAFSGGRRLALGAAGDVAAAVWAEARCDPGAAVAVFDASGTLVDLDLRGTQQDVETRYRPVAARPRGRPRLGVTPREVTLLPRHWDWLATQQGGASATLRRLVEQAKKAADAAGDPKPRREAAYRFMSAISGDRPGFEEASRALFAGDRAVLAERMAQWPADIITQIMAYLEPDRADV